MTPHPPIDPSEKSPSTTTGHTQRLVIMLAITAFLGYVTLILLMNRLHGIHRYEISHEGKPVGMLTVDLPIDFVPCEIRQWMPVLVRQVDAKVQVVYPTDPARAFSGTISCNSLRHDAMTCFLIGNHWYILGDDGIGGDVRIMIVSSDRSFRDTLTAIP